MKQKELNIQFTLKKDTKQWLYDKNYIISVNCIKNNLVIDLYDTQIFKRVLTLKYDEEKYPTLITQNNIHEKTHLSPYDNFKLFHSNQKLYLFGYTEHIFNCVLSKPTELGIFEMNIEDKTLYKKRSFVKYINFIDNEKDNKIYFLLNDGIMIYDFSTNNQNRIVFKYPGPYKKLILVEDYIVILSMEIFFYKSNHKLFISIFDKNLQSLRPYNNNIIVLDNYFEYEYNTVDYFIPISERRFLLETEYNNINIAEFGIKGRENLLKSCKEKEGDYGEIEYEFNNHNEEDGQIPLLNDEVDIGNEDLIDYVFKKHVISIKEEVKNFYPYFQCYFLNNDVLGIVGKDVYIYNISSLKPIIQLKLPFNAFEKHLAIIKYQKENDKYKLYLGNKNEMILFTSS